MPRYTKGDRAIETTAPAEGARLVARGFTEQKARTKRVREADEAAASTVPAPEVEPERVESTSNQVKAAKAEADAPEPSAPKSAD